jgi:hypothetical protein
MKLTTALTAAAVALASPAGAQEAATLNKQELQRLQAPPKTSTAPTSAAVGYPGHAECAAWRAVLEDRQRYGISPAHQQSASEIVARCGLPHAASAAATAPLDRNDIDAVVAYCVEQARQPTNWQKNLHSRFDAYYNRSDKTIRYKDRLDSEANFTFERCMAEQGHPLSWPKPAASRSCTVFA